MNVALSGNQVMASGDIRQLGDGDIITLHPSIRGRHDLTPIMAAVSVAIVRGASVVWARN